MIIALYCKYPASYGNVTESPAELEIYPVEFLRSSIHMFLPPNAPVNLSVSSDVASTCVPIVLFFTGIYSVCHLNTLALVVNHPDGNVELVSHEVTVVTPVAAVMAETVPCARYSVPLLTSRTIILSPTYRLLPI